MILGIEVHSEFVVEFSWHEWLQEDFHLNVGAAYLFSPASVPNVFASWDHSSDVWRIWTNSFSYLMLRVMLLEIGVESGVLIASKVQPLQFSKGLGWKESLREKDVRVFSDLFVPGRYLGMSTERNLCLFGLGYSAGVQFFKGLFSNPFHGL